MKHIKYTVNSVSEHSFRSVHMRPTREANGSAMIIANPIRVMKAFLSEHSDKDSFDPSCHSRASTCLLID